MLLRLPLNKFIVNFTHNHVITRTNSRAIVDMKIKFWSCLNITWLKNNYPAFKIEIRDTISEYKHTIISTDSFHMIGQVLKVSFDWVDKKYLGFSRLMLSPLLCMPA